MSALERVKAAGQARWPEVRVSDARLAARAEDADGEHDADVYLAAALSESDPQALQIFERELVPEIDAALARMRLPAAVIDEVRQAIRVEMLVPEGDDDPLIDGYLGRGPLAAWLRVSASRRALKILRQTRREDTLDDVLVAHWPDPGASPERQHLLRTYAAELKAAVATALGELTVRERNLLRQHLLDGLTLDELALIYRVHRSSCARWVVDARAALGRATRRALSARLGPREAQLESVLRFVDSDLELSLSRLLAE